jgi:hypothetical protein
LILIRFINNLVYIIYSNNNIYVAFKIVKKYV